MTPAEARVRDEIAAHGPMGFDRLMEIALYDAEVGFYATSGRAGGARGDFITSPETGPLFGVLVGRYLDRIWRECDEPADFTFVDVGAGPGTLARTLQAAAPQCQPHIVCVERSAAQRALHPDGVESVADMPSDVGPGVVFANELVDNVPAKIAEMDEDGWVEVVVSVVDDSLAFLRGEALVVDLPDAPPGSRVPVLGRHGTLAAMVSAGAGIVIDYGGTTAELATRGGGWLRTYRHHERGSDPLADLGTRDITLDVPFDQLPAADHECTQADWLASLGIDDLVSEGRRIWDERGGVGDLAALQARSRINEAAALTDPSGLGGFTVLQWTR